MILLVILHRIHHSQLKKNTHESSSHMFRLQPCGVSCGVGLNSHEAAVCCPVLSFPEHHSENALYPCKSWTIPYKAHIRSDHQRRGMLLGTRRGSPRQSYVCHDMIGSATNKLIFLKISACWERFCCYSTSTFE